ncbi:MAG: adenosylmethionine decarboxylase, partial [Rhodospirillaceae bacterium]|nr:adenosylmethionine decarboxylase [Rhodospirillaceae bacterium]
MVWTNSQLPQNTTRIVSDDYFVEQDGLTFAGTHLLLDLWGADNLADSEQVEKVLSEAAEA